MRVRTALMPAPSQLPPFRIPDNATFVGWQWDDHYGYIEGAPPPPPPPPCFVRVLCCGH